MITKRRYLRLCTMLPFVAPVVLYMPVLFAEVTGWRLPRVVGYAASVSFSAVFMFGVPYIALIVMLLIVVWRHSWKAHVAAAVSAPVLMVGAGGLWLWVLGDSDAWSGAMYFAPWCLGVGYAYVGLTLVVMYVLAKAGRFRLDKS